MVSTASTVWGDGASKVTRGDKHDVFPKVLGLHFVHEITDRRIHLSKFTFQTRHMIGAVSCARVKAVTTITLIDESIIVPDRQLSDNDCMHIHKNKALTIPSSK